MSRTRKTWDSAATLPVFLSVDETLSLHCRPHTVHTWWNPSEARMGGPRKFAWQKYLCCIALCNQIPVFIFPRISLSVSHQNPRLCWRFHHFVFECVSVCLNGCLKTSLWGLCLPFRDDWLYVVVNWDFMSHLWLHLPRLYRRYERKKRRHIREQMECIYNSLKNICNRQHDLCTVQTEEFETNV